MSERKRTYQWFAEPLDAYTNQVLAANVSAENFLSEARINAHECRPLWQLQPHQVSNFLRNKNLLDLKFNIYVREGSGAIRKARFLRYGRGRAILGILGQIKKAATLSRGSSI